VQGSVEAALRQLGWTGDSILSAGRTDTGVHALGQVVAFDLDWAHSTGELQAALNSLLPGAVSVRAAKLVRDEFHPRYDAVARCYRYHLFCEADRHPLRERYAWRVWPAVDAGRMSTSACALVGKHDFAAFGTPPRADGSTIRTLFEAGWEEINSPFGGEELVFQVSGDAFLYRMVRRLVSIQVEVGQGRLDPGVVAECLRNPPPNPVQGLAPPNGLVLVGISYAV
jgi:tRNA pseudouridine38-40 synthase